MAKKIKTESTPAPTAPAPAAPAKPVKNPCPISREEFVKIARALRFAVGQQEYGAMPHQFSTGSFGWFYQGKILVELPGFDTPLPVQVGINMTVVGSKEAK